MEQRTIGELDVSIVGVGCNNFGMRIDADQSAAVVHAALDVGINFFDTADVYGETRSEEFLGEALKGRRDGVIIATKFGAGGMDEGLTGGSPEWIRRAVDNSLRRLSVEYIDLYQMHTPDASVPLADTLGALHELVESGKVLEIGCSNFDTALLGEAKETATARDLTQFRSLQNRYSVLHREPEAEVLPACSELNVGFLPYFPLEAGLLTGKVGADGPPPGSRLDILPEERRANFLNDDRLDRVRVLTSYASDHGRSTLELAMSYLASQPQVASVIAGASNADQINANAASTSWVMSEDELGEIREIVS
jgi:aryl-alcohol dehydrogenase-like predicted oxidoreductase